MSHTNAFRSHLMQQFVAQSSRQSRPPLVLTSVVRPRASVPSSTATTNTNSDSQQHSFLASSVPGSSVACRVQATRASHSSHVVNVSPGLESKNKTPGTNTSTQRQSSTSATASAAFKDSDEKVNNDPPNSMSRKTEHAPSFQNILTSRRTTSNYLPQSTWSSQPDTLTFLRSALHRAITCAIQAPNHRRTEPWAFKTLVYPSAKRQALVDLMYDVTFHTSNHDMAKASSKRLRWDNVPA